MTSISDASSLQRLLGIEGSSSTSLAEVLSSVSGSNSITSDSDTVNLSSGSLALAKTLLGSLSGDSSDSADSFLNLLSGSSDDSSDSVYDFLLSAANAEILSKNPDLVSMIHTVNESEASDGGSSTTDSGTASTEDIDLFTMSSSDLASILEKYRTLSSSTASTATSLVDETI